MYHIYNNFLVRLWADIVKGAVTIFMVYAPLYDTVKASFISYERFPQHCKYYLP